MNSSLLAKTGWSPCKTRPDCTSWTLYATWTGRQRTSVSSSWINRGTRCSRHKCPFLWDTFLEPFLIGSRCHATNPRRTCSRLRKRCLPRWCSCYPPTCCSPSSSTAAKAEKRQIFFFGVRNEFLTFIITPIVSSISKGIRMVAFSNCVVLLYIRKLKSPVMGSKEPFVQSAILEMCTSAGPRIWDKDGKVLRAFWWMNT